MTFNNFTSLPFVPYKIISYLAENNQKIFKALYYQDINALSQPDLTFEQIIGMIYVDEGKEIDKHIFLKPLVGDEMIDSATQLRLYKYKISPVNSMVSVINYRFDIITGTKTSMIYYDGVPCNRLDIIESELLNTLNGVDLFGTGKFQFNKDLSNDDKQILTLSNSKAFYGSILMMSVRWVGITGNECG